MGRAIRVCLRHGVPARWAKRPATDQATQREPQATPATVDLEGLDGVGAARWREATGGGASLRGLLIADDQANQEGIRSSRPLRSNCSSTRDFDAAMGLAPNRNIPAGSRPPDDASCNMARNWRRTRFRTTAGPSARPRANATRGGVVMPGGSRMYVHHRTPARARCPSAVRRANSRRSRMRQIKPTACGGPCRAVPSAQRGRPGCSSADGSHASWLGGGYWVGRCASRSPPRAAHGSTHGSTTNSFGTARRTAAANARTASKTTVARHQVATEARASTTVRRRCRNLLRCAPCAVLVVHTMWTMMWMLNNVQKGGAGERP